MFPVFSLVLILLILFLFSAIESIQNVRAAHKPYWKWLMYEGKYFCLTSSKCDW